MKKLILILAILILSVGCKEQPTQQNCRKCKGASQNYINSLNNMNLSYEEIMSRIADANRCTNLTCDDNDYCFKHR